MPQQPSGVLVPAYVYPQPGPPPAWDVLTEVGRTLMLGGLMVVANHDDGHFDAVDQNYANAIEALRNICTPVLGYVHDCYDNTKTDDNCPRTTGIMDDVARWFNTYGVDGIFIDQILRERVGHAQTLVQGVLNRRSDATIVLNPGSIPSEDFMTKTHPAIVVIQEQAFAEYGDAWPPDGWVRDRAMGGATSIAANRIAIIAHTLPNQEDVDLLIAKAAQYNIGWIYAQHTTGSVYDPFSIHLRYLAERLSRCSRMGCTLPFGRLLCLMANYLLCYILRMNARLRAAVKRRAHDGAHPGQRLGRRRSRARQDDSS
jgi:hypothetical protein